MSPNLSFRALLYVLFGWTVVGCGGGAAEQAGPTTPESPAGTAAPDAEAPPVDAAADAGVPTEPLAAADAAPAVDADAAPAVDPVAEWNAKVQRGRQRYGRSCYAPCHDPGMGLGAPNLAGRRLTARRLRSQVRQGSGDMDPIPVRRLSDEDLDAIVAYLSTVGGVRDVTPPVAATP